MIEQLVRITCLDREPELIVHRDLWHVIQDGLKITQRTSARAAVRDWNVIARRINNSPQRAKE